MVTPRDTLKDLLYSRRNLPCLHDRTIQFPLGIGHQSPLLTLLFIFIVTRSENEYNYFHSHPLIPGLVNSGSGRNCVIRCTLLKVILLPREGCPHAPSYCLLTGTVTVSSERIYPFFQTSCLLMGSMVRPVESMIMGPLLHFSGCEETSWIRNSAVWNIMMLDKAFCKSVMVILAEALCTGKVNL